jgi:membrane associated rhomboid family serine protease
MDFTAYIVIGAVVSVIVQFLKNKYGTENYITIIIVAGISVVAGSLYFFLKDTNYWQGIVSILGFAGAIYTYILKRFES